MSGFDDTAEEMWELFEQESEDYLAQIERVLSGSAADLASAETMGALFRAFHSLKGVSASLGLTGIESVAHHGEDLLDMFRNGEAQPDEATRQLLLETADHLVDLRESCLDGRSDVAGSADLIKRLKDAKAQLKAGGSVAQPEPRPAPDPAPKPAAKPAAKPATDAAPAKPQVKPQAQPKPKPKPTPPPPPAPEPEETDSAAAQSEMAIQVSQAPADPSEVEFQAETVQIFSDVLSAELGQLAEALENPEFDQLDTHAITGSVQSIREAADEVGYLGIVDVLDGIIAILRDSDRLDRTALTRGLCLLVHRLRVLSELAESGLSMDDVDDSMSPHISREARDVVDRLSAAGGRPEDWELIGVLARALGVYRISALARLTSELTVMEDWRDRPGALDVVEEIRQESQVVGIEGLNVSALDMRRPVYDRLRDEMALLLTNAGAGVAALRQQLGDEVFNSLSPAARSEIAEFLKEPGANLVEVRAMLPEGDPVAQDMLDRIFKLRVISNRVLVHIDPSLYQFLIGIIGNPKPPMLALQRAAGDSEAIEAWDVLIQGETALPEDDEEADEVEDIADAEDDDAEDVDGVEDIGEPDEAHQSAQADASDDRPVLYIDDDAWESALKRPTTSVPDQPIPEAPSPTRFASDIPEAPAETPPVEAPSVETRPVETRPAEARPATQPATQPAAVSKVTTERSEAASRSGGGSTLRVSSDLVDKYLDTIAELRLCLSRLDQGAAEAGFAGTTAELRSLATQTGARKAERLRAAAAQIDDAGKVIANQIARAETTLRMLHSVTLDLRVVPISIVLGRMPRLVRDLSRSLGKQVDLDIDDGDIQIDKSMVDALMEPMVHMIRNAMDHGIENPDERVEAGKPREARLTLRATQNGHVAQIMIADDGRGLNTDRIRAKAVERGLMSQQDAARMSEREIHRQIFAPGFSTASAVTETSGRGVGMDVVLVTMRRLGGSIDIDSVEGEGTRFYLSFPVSAALQRIIVVSDGERDLGLPERAIVEVIEIEESRIQTVGDLQGIEHRDGFLPVRPIEEMLGWDTPEETAKQTVFPVVIIGTPQRRVGVAVAQIKRRQEVFMKEIHPALNMVDVLAGATVMGEGQPLLVLDPETLIAIAGG
jgi:chemotaxis protein histidine kinase CheA